MCRRSSTTITGASLRYRARDPATAKGPSAPTYAATARTTSARALPSCIHGGRGRLHHRQLHQPDPLPAPRRRHLQERSASSRARSISPSPVRRRHGPNPAPGQHGRRPCLLRHDRHHGPHALRRAVRRLVLRARARGHDGLSSAWATTRWSAPPSPWPSRSPKA